MCVESLCVCPPQSLDRLSWSQDSQIGTCCVLQVMIAADHEGIARREGQRHQVVVLGVGGRATARAFAEWGFDVALLARGEAGLGAAAKEVEDAGSRALAVPTDVSQFAEVDAAASKVDEEFGPIDVWVNDAVTTVFAPAWEVKPEDFQRAIEVTFLGQVWGTMAALARMRPRDHAAIVNIGSALAFIGIPLQSAYCSSKFACRGFFESTRAELIHEGSHVRMSMSTCRRSTLRRSTGNEPRHGSHRR